MDTYALYVLHKARSDTEVSRVYQRKKRGIQILTHPRHGTLLASVSDRDHVTRTQHVTNAEARQIFDILGRNASANPHTANRVRVSITYI